MRRYNKFFMVAAGFFFNCQAAMGLEFEPGVGVGIEFTDNAKMTQNNEVSDQIATAYVGAKLVEKEGYLKYDAKASVNKHNYLQNTYSDQRYFYLSANANWEMVPEQFNWFIHDTFSQRLNNTLDANTPNNLQDTNVFKFGAHMNTANNRRHYLSLYPVFSQYYYEQSQTDNRQYAVSANYAYRVNPTLSTGLTLGTREVDYIESNLVDTAFTDAAVNLDMKRVSSEYNISLGATNVKRDNITAPDQDDTGFSGSIKLSGDLSSRSQLKALLLSKITDTSSVSHGVTVDENYDVELLADVIRNSIVNLSYNRSDEELRSRVWAEYRKIKYNENTDQNRIERAVGASMNYPLTQLLSGGVYAQYKRIELVNSNPFREDKRYTIGGHLTYRFSPKLHTSFDLKYRSKDSTLDSEDYDEVSLFANLVYGFSAFIRPTRAGAY